MKTLSAKAKISGLTLIELLLVICVIAVLAALLLPFNDAHNRARIINCQNNLKGIDESFVAWSQKHDGKLPMQVSSNEGGTLDFIQSGNVSIHFLALTNSGLTFVHHDIDAYSRDGKDYQRINSYTNWNLC